MCAYFLVLLRQYGYLSGRVNLGVIIGMFGDYRGPLLLGKE